MPMARWLCSLVVFVLCWGLSGAASVEAQRLVDRGLATNPFWDTTAAVAPGEHALVAGYGGWAAFGPYLAGNEAHAWHHEIGGYVELWRAHRSSLLVTTQIEFIADPNNEIRFNPRAVFWEEGIVFTRRGSAVDWQVGYYHRCKHDVDNLARGTQRALIFGSLRSRVFIGTPRAGDYLALDADLYTIRQDARQPRVLEAEGRNWNQWLGSMGLQGFTQRAMNDYLGIYAGGFGRMLLLSANEGFVDRFTAINRVQGSIGASAGLSVQGQATLRIGLEYEYQPDTGIPAVPNSAHLLRLVVRAQPLHTVR